MSTSNFCPFCGAPAPAPPATVCRYCRYSWAPFGVTSSVAPVAPAAPPPVAPCTTFNGLTFEETLAAARRHLEPLDTLDIRFSPEILPSKERNARQIHGGHLPPEEPLVVLHDSTLLGSGEDGFVLTARRFCWKNSFFNPQAIPWRSLDVQTLRQNRTDVMVLGSPVSCLNGDLSLALLSLLGELAGEAQRRMPPVASASASHAEGMIELIRRHLGVHDALFVAPAIPEKKERNVRKVYKLDHDERVVALFDNTVFGSAEEGFVFTDRRFCWNENFEDPRSVPWGQLSLGQAVLQEPSDGSLKIQGASLFIVGTSRDVVARGLVSLLDAIIESRGGYR